MPASLSNYDEALKDDYGPGLKNAVNNVSPVLTEVKMNTEDVVGRQAVWSLHVSRSGSSGARAELASLPAADRQRFAQARDDLAYNYHTIKVSGQAKHLTRNDTGSFVRALETELKGAETDLKQDRARQIYGRRVTINSVSYNGSIGTITGGDTNTLIMTGLSAAEMRYFFRGMELEVINGSTGASRGHATVSSVDKANKTVELASTIAGTTTNDHVVRYGSLGNEINGLRFLIGSADYANVTVASVPEFAAQSIGDTSTPISEVILDEAAELPMTDGGGETPTLWLAEPSQRRKLASQLQAQKRYDGRDVTLPAGWKGLQLAYGTLVTDRFNPTPYIFGIYTPDLERFVGLDWTWDDDSGSVLYKALDDSDAVQARFKVYDNIEAPNRNNHVLVTLSTPTF